jgi:hypothetical protein
MSYLLPRARRAVLIRGDLATISFPTPAEVVAQLSPPDVFGAAASVDARAVFKRSAPGQRFHWNANTGEYKLISDQFLNAFILERKLQNGIQLSILKDTWTARFEAVSFDDVMAVVQFLEFCVANYLTLTTDVFISVEKITATINKAIELRYELGNLSFGVQVLDEEGREKFVAKTLEFCALDNSSVPRLSIACLYYQQALRLKSPLEVRVPSLDIAEISLNLAKSLQILFGNRADQVRKGCKQLGYTDDQIESQITPLLIARDTLDIAHSAGRPMPQDLIEVLREYLGRASMNVRSVLLRAAKAIGDGTLSLPDLDSTGRKDEKQSLIESLREYLQMPPLGSDM